MLLELTVNGQNRLLQQYNKWKALLSDAVQHLYLNQPTRKDRLKLGCLIACKSIEWHFLFFPLWSRRSVRTAALMACPQWKSRTTRIQPHRWRKDEWKTASTPVIFAPKSSRKAAPCSGTNMNTQVHLKSGLCYFTSPAPLYVPVISCRSYSATWSFSYFSACINQLFFNLQENGPTSATCARRPSNTNTTWSNTQGCTPVRNPTSVTSVGSGSLTPAHTPSTWITATLTARRTVQTRARVQDLGLTGFSQS